MVAGGDGTINEAAEGMIGTPVPLAILPAGTANVLATEMKLGGNLEKVARRPGRTAAATDLGGPRDLRRRPRRRGTFC